MQRRGGAHIPTLTQCVVCRMDTMQWGWRHVRGSPARREPAERQTANLTDRQTVSVCQTPLPHRQPSLNLGQRKGLWDRALQGLQTRFKAIEPQARVTALSTRADAPGTTTAAHGLAQVRRSLQFHRERKRNATGWHWQAPATLVSRLSVRPSFATLGPQLLALL